MGFSKFLLFLLLVSVSPIVDSYAMAENSIKTTNLAAYEIKVLDVIGEKRVVLGKNVQEFPQEENGHTIEKNILTQSMLSTPNTIYCLQYDYDLNGETIQIPDNSTLEFDGGSIVGNGTLVGKNTGINAGLVKIFDGNIILHGSWNVQNIHVCWFGLNSNDTSIDFGASLTNIISKTQHITQNTYWSQGYYYGGIKFKLSQGVYYNKSTVNLESGNVLSNWTLEGYSKGSTIVINSNPDKPVFLLTNPQKESRRNWIIRDIVFRENDGIHIFQPTRTILENCYFLGCRYAII